MRTWNRSSFKNTQILWYFGRSKHHRWLKTFILCLILYRRTAPPYSCGILVRATGMDTQISFFRKSKRWRNCQTLGSTLWFPRNVGRQSYAYHPWSSLPCLKFFLEYQVGSLATCTCGEGMLSSHVIRRYPKCENTFRAP